MPARLGEIAEHLDELLEIDAVEDASLNGLQVEAGSEVSRVGVAVDAAQLTVDRAVDEGCQLLLVHHGLFWGGASPLTGRLGAAVGACFAGGLSVYAAHLPLDRHAEVGNNALLGQALGGHAAGDFGVVGGVPIGALFELDEPCAVAELGGRLAAAGCAEQLIWDFGPERVRRLAVVTGSGCSLLEEAAAAGADCFVTGEPKHSAYHAARELAIHCLFGGHYDTETFGVRAVAERLADRFDLETVWIDHPTGI